MGNEIVLSIQNISYGYDQILVEALSFDLKQGEIIWLQGENGSGKTTLAKCIMGIHSLLKGDILLHNQSIKKLSSAKISQSIGYLFQQPSLQLFANTVWEECTYFSSFFEHQDEMIERAKEYLALFELNDVLDQHPQLISRGQQQRLALIISLLLDPPFLIFDEPTTALDDDLKHTFLHLILKLKNKGILIISHDEIIEQLPISQKVVIA